VPGLSHLAGPWPYLAVFLVVLLEAVGVPSPDEVTLFAAGLAAGRGLLSWPLVMLAATLGAAVGANVSYLIAVKGGRPLLLHYGRRVGLTEARVASAERFFMRYGHAAVFLGRIISGVRLVVGYAAGLFGVPWHAFAVYSVLGAAAWAVLDVGAGVLIGRRLPAIEQALAARWPWGVGVALLIVAAAAGYARARRRRGAGTG
jgi:membrane protein DedA with SNARE-associated domain